VTSPADDAAVDASAAPALARRLGLGDAIALGLAGMIGTGVLVVAGPVARVAGPLILVSLTLAAAVAACNATSAARLAARFPVSGGAYHWGRELLHPALGSLAGWCFVVGKVASSAAAGLAVGLYAAEAVGVEGETGRRVLVAAVALAVVVAVTVANALGIRRTAAASRWLLVGVVTVLVGVVVASLAAGDAPAAAPDPGSPGSAGGWSGVPAGAGLFFLAFAGYARIATLGEEVRDPGRTIPRAIATTFAVALALYLAVVGTAVSVLGVERLAATTTPVADLAAGVGPVLVVAVAVAGAAAATAVSLGVQAGVSRVLLAMARAGELPPPLARIHPTRRTPYLADLAVGTAVCVVVLVGGVVAAIAVSAGTVLVYYAVANAAALRLPGSVGRAAAAAGLLGCLALAGTLAVQPLA
jgi:APA family basic amino acid/polyamine antiporter